MKLIFQPHGVAYDPVKRSVYWNDYKIVYVSKELTYSISAKPVYAPKEVVFNKGMTNSFL